MTTTPAHDPDTNSAPPAVVSRLPKGYVAFWGIAACASLTYLALTIAQPGMLGHAPMSAETAPDRSQAQTSLATDADRALSDAQMELAMARTKMSQESEQNTKVEPSDGPPATVVNANAETTQNGAQFSVPGIVATTPATPPQSTATQLAANDTTPTPETAPIQKQAEAEAEAAALPKAPTPAEIAAAQRAAIKVPPIPARAPTPPVNITRVIDTAKQTGAAITQRTTKIVPINFGEATQPSKPSPLIGVRLGTGPSIEALRLTWSFLLEHHQPVLQGLEPRYFLSPGQEDNFGPTYALVAGPMSNEAQARSVCLSLASRGMKCDISLFGGSTL